MISRIKNIIFDLDGTLLPMDINIFLESYYKNFAITIKRYPEYDFKKFVEVCEYGIYAMIKNDGKITNEEKFWTAVSEKYSLDNNLIDLFNDFYNNEYKNMKNDMGYQKLAQETLLLLKEKGYKLYCFTSPLFPYTATIERLHWAGIDEKLFESITTFENSKYAKPNIKYYEESLSKNNLDVDSVLMVGNDVNEDLPIKKLGAKTYLITDCLINSKNLEINSDYVGSFKEFNEFVKNNL